MNEITVDKFTLIQTIKANRDTHTAEFLTAQEKYREKVIETLDRRLRDARNGGKIKTYINLPEPVDYTSSYDTVIDMLSWELDETVTLSRQDFERYVLNKWEWSAQFAASTQSYLA